MKRFISGAIVTGLVVAGILFPAGGANANGCISHVTGDGSAGRPLLVSTPQEMTCLQNNSVDYWAVDLHFLQTNDIEMQGQAAWTAGIGDAAHGEFRGHFDGGGHTIANLRVSVVSVDAGLDGVGMFGRMAATSSVTGVRLRGAAVSATTTSTTPAAVDLIAVGLLAGSALGDISNNEATGAVSVSSAGSATNIGGLVGFYAGAFAPHNVSVDAVTSVTAIQAENIGGLIGLAGGGDLTFARADGRLRVAGCSGGAENIGGLIGALVGGISDTESATSVVLRVDSPTEANGIGGLVGYAETSSISRSAAVGAVVVSGISLGGSYGGGIYMTSSVMSLDSYATGLVTGLVGGIAGVADASSVVSDSFWDSETTGMSRAVGGGTGATVTHVNPLRTALMHAYNTFINTTDYLDTAWDIRKGFESPATTVWGICDGQTYPFLTAFTKADPCTSTASAAAPAVVPPVLAATGLESPGLQVPGLAALMLALLGTVLMGTARRRKRAFRP